MFKWYPEELHHLGHPYPCVQKGSHRVKSQVGLSPGRPPSSPGRPPRSQDQGPEAIGWGNGSWTETIISPRDCRHHGSQTAQGVLSRVRLFVATWTVAARLFCLWNFPGKNTGVGCHVLLQGIFPTQGSNLCLLPDRQILCH